MLASHAAHALAAAPISTHPPLTLSFGRDFSNAKNSHTKMGANRDQTSHQSKKAKVDKAFPPACGYEIVYKDDQNRFFSYSSGFNRRYRHQYSLKYSHSHWPRAAKR